MNLSSSTNLQASFRNALFILTVISVFEALLQHREEQNDESRQQHTRLDADSSIGVCGKYRERMVTSRTQHTTTYLCIFWQLTSILLTIVNCFVWIWAHNWRLGWCRPSHWSKGFWPHRCNCCPGYTLWELLW